ncbi:MAG: AAA family ATPase [Pseudomonadota bacterium]
MAKHILITGCSGGGKSTLLAALAQRGHAVVREPGERIVRSEMASGGDALPWSNLEAFLWRALDMAREDLAHATDLKGPIIHDRGLLDAAVGLRDVFGVLFSVTMPGPFPYASPVIIAPPWPEHFSQTQERRHGFDEAVDEYDRICGTLDALGHSILSLPFADVATRVEWIERHLC